MGLALFLNELELGAEAIDAAGAESHLAFGRERLAHLEGAGVPAELRTTQELVRTFEGAWLEGAAAQDYLTALPAQFEALMQSWADADYTDDACPGTDWDSWAHEHRMRREETGISADQAAATAAWLRDPANQAEPRLTGWLTGPGAHVRPLFAGVVDPAEQARVLVADLARFMDDAARFGGYHLG